MISRLQSIKSRWALLFILALAFLIRVIWIELVPPALNWDEVSHGYNAYSILKTGFDEWGERTPLIFRAYGDYKLPVYIYLTAASELFLGLNVLSVRLPSIIAGTFAILFTYLLVKKVFKKDSIALAASLLMAIEPWSLFLSRAALEANIALALIISGMYLLLLGLERKNYNLVLGIFLLGLSVWTYNSARIFVPLLVIAITLIYKAEFLRIVKTKKTLATGFLLLAIFFFVPMFIQLNQSTGQARYENVRILDQGAIGKIVELRNNSSFGGPINRVLFNKATYFSSQFLVNYAKHFSPEFLFLKGGDNYQFNVPNVGLLYLINMPFFVLGLIKLFRDHQKRSYGKFIIAWMLLAPVASSLTREAPHTLRSVMMLPVPMILTALGLSYIFEKASKLRWLLVLYFVFLAISFADYFNNYLRDYKNNYSWAWQYGYEEVVGKLKEKYDAYEKFVITKKYGEPHEFLLFYWPWNPEKYINDEKIRYFQSNWYWVDKFDKFYFVNDWDIPKVGSQFTMENGGTFDCASCLLVTSPGNAPENWKKIETVNFLNGKAAFEIYEH